MKNEKTNISFVTLICLIGCINFNPKGRETEKIREDFPDDSVMQNSPHLKFKNVPIDGSLDKFVACMVRSGFKTEKKTADQAILSGDFADFKECVVYVETLKDKDLVSKIAVCFPNQDQWEYLYGDYKHLKELLTVKYGKPSSCVEKFQNSYGLTPTNDNDRMHYVHFDKCKYETRFATDKGEIVLWIEHESVSRAFVMLLYKDKINGSIIKKHAIDDL
jgi:hypothetical protein